LFLGRMEEESAADETAKKTFMAHLEEFMAKRG